MEPDTGTLRVVRWLREIQLDSDAANAASLSSYRFVSTVTGSTGPDVDLESPLKPSKFLLAPSELTQDNRMSGVIMNGTKVSPLHITDADGSVTHVTRARSSSRSDTARLRELGLIISDDFDRASGTKIDDHIAPNESASQLGVSGYQPPRLLRQNAFCFDSKVATEAQVAANMRDCYLQTPEEKVQIGSLTAEHNVDENLQYKHATAPYPNETRKLSLVSIHDDKSMDHVKPKGKSPLSILSIEDVKTHQKSIYSSENTIDSSEWPLKSRQSFFFRGCVDFPPKKLHYGDPFELTASEASIGTPESQCTGDGSCVAIEDSEAGQFAIIHKAESEPSAQAAQVEGTFGHDGDVQIPIFPFAHKTTRCRAITCPIKGKHEKGPYLHEGKLRAREGNIFGSSNPPQKIWDAYDRIKDSNGGLGGKDKDQVAAKDVRMVTRFARHHFGHAREWGMEDSDSGSGFDACSVG